MNEENGRPASVSAESLARRMLHTHAPTRRGWLYRAWWLLVPVAAVVAFMEIPYDNPAAEGSALVSLLAFATALALRGLAEQTEAASAAMRLQDVGAESLGALIELLRWPVKRVRDTARWRLIALLRNLPEGAEESAEPVQLACLYDWLTPMQSLRQPDLVEAILAALPRIADENAIPAVLRLAKMKAWTRDARRIRDSARAVLPEIERRVETLRTAGGSAKTAPEGKAELLPKVPHRAFGEELGVHPQMRVLFLILAWLAVVPGGAWLCLTSAQAGNWLEAAAWAVVALGATQLHRLTLMSRHARMAHSILREENPEAVGRIAEAALWPDGRIRAAAMSTLARLLPRLKASDAGILTSSQRGCLNGLLNRTTAQEYPETVVALLRALEQIGDVSAMRYVQSLVDMPGRSARIAAVREAARECLPVLAERARLNTDPQVLLRPAEAPGAPSEILVRPASGAPVADDMMLVRPADAPDG